MSTAIEKRIQNECKIEHITREEWYERFWNGQAHHANLGIYDENDNPVTRDDVIKRLKTIKDERREYVLKWITGCKVGVIAQEFHWSESWMLKIINRTLAELNLKTRKAEL